MVRAGVRGAGERFAVEWRPMAVSGPTTDQAGSEGLARPSPRSTHTLSHTSACVRSAVFLDWLHSISPPTRQTESRQSHSDAGEGALALEMAGRYASCIIVTMVSWKVHIISLMPEVHPSLQQKSLM